MKALLRSKRTHAFEHCPTVLPFWTALHRPAAYPAAAAAAVAQEGPSAARGQHGGSSHAALLWSRASIAQKSAGVAAALEPRLSDANATAVARKHVRGACRHLLGNRSTAAGADSGHRSVVVLAEPGANFCAALLGTWMCGRMAIPLCHTNPPAELAFIVKDSGAKTLLCSPATLPLAREVLRTAAGTAAGSSRVRIVVVNAGRQHQKRKRSADIGDTAKAIESLQGALGRELRRVGVSKSSMDALMIYTSGTTGKPKGVAHTFGSVANQVQVLLDAWRWQPKDRILNALPLHHVHGLVNVTLCALTVGAECVFAYPFDKHFIFHRLASPTRPITLFMSVPPAYSKLQEHYDAPAPTSRELQEAKQKEVAAFHAAARSKIRLFISGSSALPPTVRSNLEKGLLRGHTILERYGMTEIGMALSQPYAPSTHRIAGSVGTPLPTVDTAFRNAATGAVTPVTPALLRTLTSPMEGELLIASPSVFDRYWRRPDATKETFLVDPVTHKRWFLTGDAAELTPAAGDVPPQYRITGRLSTDILKINSFKVSALDVETALLESGLIAEVAVFAKVATATSTTDTMVAAVAVPAGAKGVEVLQQLQAYAKANLAHYKCPREWVGLVKGLPRNAMGKVNKKDLAKRYAAGTLHD